MTKATSNTTRERRHSETLLASPSDSKLAASVCDALRNAPRRRRRRCTLVGPTGRRIELSHSFAAVLERVAAAFARGTPVFVSPIDVELTTQLAARLLGVSRQYVVRLIDAGKIPGRKTGTHRRVTVSDVLAYKTQRDLARRTALDDLARISQETKGGYAELGR